MPDEPIPQVYVLPGESQIVTGPTVLRTVLGSCVGITFHVPRLAIGALCHPMLPRTPARRPATVNIQANRRYVDFAIRDLAERLESLGAGPAEAQVKLFGGADVLAVSGNAALPTVGKLNYETALQVLAEEGFSLTASSLGGNTGVQILFQTQTGEVLLRRLDSTTTSSLQRSPQSFLRSGFDRKKVQRQP